MHNFVQVALRDSSSTVDPNSNQYGYVPTLWICIMFVTLFSISSIMHLIHALISRHWFNLPTIVLAGCGEILGWAARLWSNRNILAGDPFTIQISCLIIAPTPLLGAHFIIFGRLVQMLGPQYSRFMPRLYSKIFLSCDLVCLVAQGVGGGLASSATTTSTLNLGGHIMLAGIVTQLCILIGFSATALEFVYRLNINKPFRHDIGNKITLIGPMDRRRKIGLYAVGFATACLFIRAVFRVIELADGWNGRVIHTQWSFNLFDAGMVTLAMYTWNFVPSSWILGSESTAQPEIGMQYIDSKAIPLEAPSSQSSL